MKSRALIPSKEQAVKPAIKDRNKNTTTRLVLEALKERKQKATKHNVSEPRGNGMHKESLGSKKMLSPTPQVRQLSSTEDGRISRDSGDLTKATVLEDVRMMSETPRGMLSTEERRRSQGSGVLEERGTWMERKMDDLLNLDDKVFTL